MCRPGKKIISLQAGQNFTPAGQNSFKYVMVSLCISFFPSKSQNFLVTWSFLMFAFFVCLFTHFSLLVYLFLHARSGIVHCIVWDPQSRSQWFMMCTCYLMNEVQDCYFFHHSMAMYHAFFLERCNRHNPAPWWQDHLGVQQTQSNADTCMFCS